jgi:CspA family cold shock protein
VKFLACQSLAGTPRDATDDFPDMVPKGCRGGPDLPFRPHAPIGAAASVATDGLRRFAAPSSFARFPGNPARHSGPPNHKEVVMPIGTVKFFNASKGYGFIAPEGGGNDAFVHISAVEKAGMSTLNQDQRVNYELETDQRGKTSAVNLTDA